MAVPPRRVFSGEIGLKPKENSEHVVFYLGSVRLSDQNEEANYIKFETSRINVKIGVRLNDKHTPPDTRGSRNSAPFQ